MFEYEGTKLKAEKQVDNSGTVQSIYRYEYSGNKLTRKVLYSEITTEGTESEGGYTEFVTDTAGNITKSVMYIKVKDGEYALIAESSYEYSNKPATIAYNIHTLQDAEFFENKYMVSKMNIKTLIGGVEENAEFNYELRNPNTKGYIQQSILTSPDNGTSITTNFEYNCD
jgi:hypothetical protein